MVKQFNANRAILLLEDGTHYQGNAFGHIGTTAGEICFNTGMTGYQEIFTDPSYFGQLLVMTNAHIGNYGIKEKEGESDSSKIAGLIVKNVAGEKYSRKQADLSIEAYCNQNKLVGISDIDTRALVMHIRSKGAMNGIISSEIEDLEQLKEKLSKVPPMKGLELASKVSTNKAYSIGDETAHYNVAVLDFGIKKSMLNLLVEHGCYLKVFPAKTTFDEIMAWNPDGFFLSNGPGDPAAMPYAIDLTKQLFETGRPIFGICLGHQVMASAVGVETEKMHHGHRGINHPVQNIITGKSEITSQNHGFGLMAQSVKDNVDKVEISHINLNDQSIEGLKYNNTPAFSVQYHPEAAPGPHDSRYLFEDFIQLLSSNH